MEPPQDSSNIKDEVKVETIKKEPGSPTRDFQIEEPSEFFPELQAEHYPFKWTPDGFKCPSCPFITKIEGCLLNHIEKKHPEVNFKREKIFKCGHCQYQTEQKAHFVSHVLRKHTPPSELQCQQCPFQARTPKFLQKHLRKHTNKYFPCPECDYEGKSRFLLKSHMSNKHQEESVQWLYCDFCKFKTKSQNLLQSHAEKMHEEEEGEELKCSKCPFKTTKSSDLRLHEERKHTELKCPHCDFTSKYKAGITRHCIYKHTSFDEVRWSQCDKCPYKAKSDTLMKVHLINEHSQVEESAEHSQLEESAK